MQNYKIKVTPETSAEVQELFFELGYGWGIGNEILKESISDIYAIFNTMGLKGEYYNNPYELEFQEITLPQLRDLVVLKRNDVNDATHNNVRTSTPYLKQGDKEYFMSNGEWVLSNCPNDLKPIIKETQMTWQDALRYLENGEDVEFYNQTTNIWHNLLDSTIRSMRSSNGKFRLKPKTIYIDGGDYTKEELFKIAGEME